MNPLNGLGPSEIGLDRLAQRLAEGEVHELIVATNPTVEGEATAHYLAQIARQHSVRPSRLAHGVPLGGELEYVDRKSTRLNSSHVKISYAVFCLKKKKKNNDNT